MFCYCAASRRLARLLTARYDRHLAAAGLTAAQFELLSLLAARQQSNGRDLADRLVVDPTTLSRNLKALCTGRLVSSEKSGTDARQVLYALTGKGLAQLTKAQPLWQKAHDETVRELESASMPARNMLRIMSTSLRG